MHRTLAALALALMAVLGSPAVAMSLGAQAIPADVPRWGVAAVAVMATILGIMMASRAFDRGTVLGVRAASALGFLFLLLCVTGPAIADTACQQFFLDGRPPALDTPPPDARELCQSAFANLYDPSTRDPVYAAEVLTSASVQAAGKIARGSDFRPDERLKPSERATLRDYRGQRTFDRGHMAPARDMTDATAESESFRLSNMVPQNKANNRGPWAAIEEAVRTLAVPRFNGGKVYVVSGPLFDGPVKRLKGHVAIPTRLFKAVFAPDDGDGNGVVVGAWIVANAADPATRFVSLEALKAETGIDLFPSLSAELHAAVALPGGARKRTGVAESQ